jgi:hypothetical protein
MNPRLSVRPVQGLASCPIKQRTLLTSPTSLGKVKDVPPSSLGALPMPPQPPQWLNFRGTSQFVGTSASGNVTVFVDAAIASQGVQNARDLLRSSDKTLV